MCTLLSAIAGDPPNLVNVGSEVEINGEGEYKYLFDNGRWYVVGGLCEADCVTPLRHPIPVTKAIEMGFG